MNGKAGEQLAALGRVAEAFRQAHVEYWLFGGWAVDFHAGAVTRAHDDLDVAAWLADLERIAELLGDEGWTHAPDVDEDGGTGYDQEGVRLELTFLVRGEDGVVHTPLRDGRGSWPDGTFANDVLELLGTTSRVVALGPLMKGKASARGDPADGAKDRADFEVLRRLSRVQDPTP